jgi:hypothetical protein
MSSIYDDLDEVIRRHREQTAAQEREKNETDRFERIEQQLGTVAEAVSRLASSAPTPPPGDGSGEEPGDPPTPPPGGDPPVPPNQDPPPPELPVERVTRLDVPRVYNGDDEPAEVSYIDPDSGETKKRKGRRKGHPSVFAVEEVELTPEPEPPASVE